MKSMKKIRKKVISADHCRGGGGAYWDLFLECEHVGSSGGYSKCPKTSICHECAEIERKRHETSNDTNTKRIGQGNRENGREGSPNTV